MNVSTSRAFFSNEYVFLYCYYDGALLVLLDTTIHLEEVLVWLGQVFVRIARSFGYNAARERDRGAIVDGWALASFTNTSRYGFCLVHDIISIDG